MRLLLIVAVLLGVAAAIGKRESEILPRPTGRPFNMPNCFEYPDHPRCRHPVRPPFPHLPNCHENPNDYRCRIYSKREMATEVAAPPEHPPHDSEDASVPSKRVAECRGGWACSPPPAPTSRRDVETAAADASGKREARQADTTDDCVTDPREINCRNSPPGECKWKLCGKDKREAAAEVAAAPDELILMAKREASQRDGFPGAFPTRGKPGKREVAGGRPAGMLCPEGEVCEVFRGRREAETAAGNPTPPCERDPQHWLCTKKRDAAASGPSKREAPCRGGWPCTFKPGKRELAKRSVEAAFNSANPLPL